MLPDFEKYWRPIDDKHFRKPIEALIKEGLSASNILYFAELVVLRDDFRKQLPVVYKRLSRLPSRDFYFRLLVESKAYTLSLRAEIKALYAKYRAGL